MFCFLICDCRGEAAHSWSLPETVRKESKRLSITKSACGRNGKQFCSTLTLNMAQANHTGFYSCKYLSIPASKKKKTESTIYIFINGRISIFYIPFVITLQWVINPPWSLGKWVFWAMKEVGQERASAWKLVECIFNAFLEGQFQPWFSRTGSQLCVPWGKDSCLCCSQLSLWCLG